MSVRRQAKRLGSLLFRWVIIAGGAGAVSAAWAGSPSPDRSGVAREYRLRLELGEASAGKIRRRIEEIRGAPPTPLTAREFVVGVEVLARLEGQPALEFARRLAFVPLPPRAIEDAVVRGWSARDADAVETWLRRGAGGAAEEDRMELVRVFLQRSGSREGAAALARARRLAGEGADAASRWQNHLLAAVEGMVEAGRHEEAHAAVRDLPPGEMRDGVLGNLVALSAEHRLEQAMTWLREMPQGPERGGALFRLVEVAAARDGAAALAFYGSLAPSERTADALELLFAHARTIPAAEAMSHIEGLTAGEDVERVIAVALTRMNDVQPPRVPWSWLARVSDWRRQEQLLRALLPRQRTPAQIRAIIEQLTFLSPASRNALVRELALTE